AAPTGEERIAPHYTVSVSPRCPREVSLLSLPALQGTTASDELSRISPPGIVAEPGRSSPPRGSLEQLVRQSPAGPPLQGSELAVQPTPEASLERLVPLVDYLAAWKLLPKVSAWVLRTVENGYAIQFGAPPPPFDGVFPTLVGPEQALVMEQEVETLLRKEAIEVVPPQHRESGFYSRYFIVPKKDGGLRPIIDLRSLWDSTTMQARLSPARIESILAAVKRVKEGRSLTVKQFQQLLGLMAAASNVIPFGLLYMRPLQWWLKSKGFSPRGNPLHMIKVTRRGLRALDMWRRPWFLNQGPVLGARCHRITLATDASLTGWGAVMSGRSARGLWHINCLCPQSCPVAK
ncbi:hypothetical protein M9458_019218, partial [Cirrhinus mrigala]